jgi:hypothetical protein
VFNITGGHEFEEKMNDEREREERMKEKVSHMPLNLTFKFYSSLKQLL